MKKIEGIQKVEVSGHFENVTEFHKTFPESTIIRIDGKNADQVCEFCESAISAGDLCFSWNDCVYTCLSCGGADASHKPIKLEG